MYCPKCKHTSFDHLSTCPKCGYDWQSIRTALNLSWLQSPGHEWLPESSPKQGEPSPSPLHETPGADTASGSQGVPALQEHEPHHADAVQSLQFETESTPFEGTDDVFQVSPVSEPVEGSSQGREHHIGQPKTSPAPPSAELSPDLAIDTEHLEDLGFSQPKQSETPAASEDSDQDIPVWEIELPQDILPSDYFPESGEKPTQAKKQAAGPDTGYAEISGDIDYDFADVEMIFPDLDENTQESTTQKAKKTPKVTDSGKQNDVPKPSSKNPLGGAPEESQ